MAKITAEEMVAAVKEMTVLELSDLVKALEAEFGVRAAAPVMAGGGGASSAPVVAAEEKTEFNVILKDVGANKINVIRVVRELTNLGLKESKDLVEGTCRTVKEDLPYEEAEQLARRFRGIAEVSVKPMTAR